VITGATDMGQGSDTVIAQIAAEEIGSESRRCGGNHTDTISALGMLELMPVEQHLSLEILPKGSEKSKRPTARGRCQIYGVKALRTWISGIEPSSQRRS